MRQYQVTRKLQVTIPKALAEKLDIKPGDSVVFGEDSGTITVKKVGGSRNNYGEVESAISEFTKDIVKIRPSVRKAESALVENLSRHITSN